MKRLLVSLLCLVLLPISALAEKTLLLTAVGDVTLGGQYNLQSREGSFTRYYQNYGSSYFLENVRFLFEADDVTVINLEGPLIDSAKGKKDKYYCFRGDTEMVSVLQNGSVELCNLSNNHAADFGKNGMKSTQNILTEAGIGYTCLQSSWIYEKDSLRIGFVSLMNTEVYTYSEWMQEEIRRLESEEGCNAVVAVFHIGSDYLPHRNQAQETMAQRAVNAGADFVVMHHAHVLQGCEIVNGRYVFYSLGNFCFGGNSKCYGTGGKIDAYQTCIVQCSLHFSDDGVYTGQQVKIYPAHTSGTYPDSDYRPVLVKGEEAQAVLALIQADTDFTLEAFNEEEGCVIQPYLPAE